MTGMQKSYHGYRASHSTGSSPEAEERNEFESPSNSTNVAHELSFFNDVELKISAELGRKTISIRQLLNLAKGSILTLNEEPNPKVRLFANGKEIGSGEVVSVNQKYGIRVTLVSDSDDK